MRGYVAPPRATNATLEIGILLREKRIATGQPIDQLAKAAGVRIGDWHRCEEGTVRDTTQTWELLHFLAAREGA